MNTTHELIVLAGALGLISVFAGVIGARFNAPILLVFLLLGILAGAGRPPTAPLLFGATPRVVIVSLVLQGSTIAPARAGAWLS
jgi:NhaP-type Na+/H+ and K+/H+ antiporter